MLPSSKVVKVMVSEIIYNILVSLMLGLFFVLISTFIIYVLHRHIPDNFVDWHERHEVKFVLSLSLIYSTITFIIIQYYLYVDTFIYTIGH